MKIQHTRYEGVEIDRDSLQLSCNEGNFFIDLYCRIGDNVISAKSTVARMEVTDEKIEALITFLRQAQETIRSSTNGTTRSEPDTKVDQAT